MKPNFLIIGAARSGTTSIYHYLSQHPNVFFSEVKELNFFSNPRYWDKGFVWYERKFRPKYGDVLCLGEASTSYTRSPFNAETARRIYEYNPNFRLIYIVRDPIKRFISHYLHNVGVGKERRDFERLLDNLEEESIAWQGLYYFQIKQYLEYFEREQILVVSMDQLKSCPESVMKDVYGFLGLGPFTEIKDLKKAHNANRNIAIKSEFGGLVSAFYSYYIEQLAIPYRIKKVFMRLSDVGSKPIGTPKLDQKQYRKLRAFYEEDAVKLRGEFGIDIDSWFMVD